MAAVTRRLTTSHTQCTTEATAVMTTTTPTDTASKMSLCSVRPGVATLVHLISKQCFARISHRIIPLLLILLCYLDPLPPVAKLATGQPSETYFTTPHGKSCRILQIELPFFIIFVIHVILVSLFTFLHFAD